MIVLSYIFDLSKLVTAAEADEGLRVYLTRLFRTGSICVRKEDQLDCNYYCTIKIKQLQTAITDCAGVQTPAFDKGLFYNIKLLRSQKHKQTPTA